MVRRHLEWVWITVGMLFHGALAATMNLGIFPWAMLALYPIWVDPEAFLAFGHKIRDRLFPPEALRPRPADDN
jgi:hypothetical protein